MPCRSSASTTRCSSLPSARRDRQTREAAVELLTSWGGTALYDATIRSLDLVSRDWGRKGVVIFSDGDDRNSLSTREKAMSRVQASDAMLYTIGFGAGAEVPQLKTKPRDLRAIHRRPRLLPAPHGRARRRSSTQSCRSWPINTCSPMRRPTRSRTTRGATSRSRCASGKYDIRARRGYRAPGPQRAER